MISAMDGSLPKKPCRTCKNKFHAGCLYKVSAFLACMSDWWLIALVVQWFNSSHSSSCPLCRSEIIH
jgi:E3 ubiquitin-protein ligase listerin